MYNLFIKIKKTIKDYRNVDIAIAKYQEEVKDADAIERLSYTPPQSLILINGNISQSHLNNSFELGLDPDFEEFRSFIPNRGYFRISDSNIEPVLDKAARYFSVYKNREKLVHKWIAYLAFLLLSGDRDTIEVFETIHNQVV